MPLLELYETKEIQDRELPVQISTNALREPGRIFFSHWHEHLEIAYFLSGSCNYTCNDCCECRGRS